MVLTLAAVLALVLIFYANHNFYQEFLSTSSAYGTSGIPKRPRTKTTVEIDFGNNRLRRFESELKASYGLEPALEAVARSGHFTFSIRNGEIYSLARILGRWTVYKNGRPVEKLSGLLIGPGDHYLIRLQK